MSKVKWTRFIYLRPLCSREIIPKKRLLANKFKPLFVDFQFEAIKSSSQTLFLNARLSGFEKS